MIQPYISNPSNLVITGRKLDGSHAQPVICSDMERFAYQYSSVFEQYVRMGENAVFWKPVVKRAGREIVVNGFDSFSSDVDLTSFQLTDPLLVIIPVVITDADWRVSAVLTWDYSRHPGRGYGFLSRRMSSSIYDVAESECRKYGYDPYYYFALGGGGFGIIKSADDAIASPLQFIAVAVRHPSFAPKLLGVRRQMVPLEVLFQWMEQAIKRQPLACVADVLSPCVIASWLNVTRHPIDAAFSDAYEFKDKFLMGESAFATRHVEANRKDERSEVWTPPYEIEWPIMPKDDTREAE